ncbi:monocarboxylate transporter 5-like isoform X2 [Parasteatoda tepidariorum]|nr:uncharacterized protein LOC107450709 isoform X1 [Parasteatoda tepidariorum]
MKNKAFNTWKSWLIAVVCCIVYCLLVLVYRLSSLFYAELIEIYNVDRKTASIPFVVMGFVRCFSGFIFGVLGERFGLQRMVYLGCYLSVLGVGASYFAHNIITLSVTLGLIYGFGFTATALLPNIIREHFDATATTLSNGLIGIGPCLTAIVFPGLVIYFIEDYGVPGSFLLSSGVILNAIPFIMILKPRNKLTKFRKTTMDIEKSESHNSQDKTVSGFEDLDTSFNNEETITNLNASKQNEDKRQLNLCEKKIDLITVTTTFNRKKIPKCSLHNKEGCHCINISSKETKNMPQNIYHQKVFEEFSNPSASNVDKQPKNVTTNITNSKHTNSQELKIACQQDDSMDKRNKEEKKGFFYTFNVFKDLTFIALILVQGLLAYTFNIWLTTMIDYSRDKGIDRSYEIYILALNPITDIAGRLGLAWVTDKGFLTVPNYCALLYILLGLSSICIALARDFAIMTLGLLVMTFAIGAFMGIYPAMSYEFIEKDKQAVSIASIGLAYAPLGFTVSPLIGYFRGHLGSYDGLYYLLAAMNFACSLIVLMLPKLANRRERMKAAAVEIVN